MRKKKFLVVLMTVLLFLSGTVLGVSAVYRVEDVVVTASLVSQAARDEVDDLQTRLTQAYQKDSSLFAGEEKARCVVEEFAYFRFLGFEKVYPNKIVVRVSEDEETYAVAVGGQSAEYYILAQDGTVLGIREDARNRADLEENLYVTGLNVTGEKGGFLQGDECLSYLFTFLKTTADKLGGIRRNVLSVAVSRPVSDSTQTMFTLTTREGVKIYVRNPSEKTQEKAKTCVDAYLSLTDRQRLEGMVVVFDAAEGMKAEYYERDVAMA